MGNALVFELGKELLGLIGGRVLQVRGRWWLGATALLALVLVVTCIPGRGGQDGDMRYGGPTEMGIGKGEFLPGTPIQWFFCFSSFLGKFSQPTARLHPRRAPRVAIPGW